MVVGRVLVEDDGLALWELDADVGLDGPVAEVGLASPGDMTLFTHFS